MSWTNGHLPRALQRRHAPAFLPQPASPWHSRIGGVAAVSRVRHKVPPHLPAERCNGSVRHLRGTLNREHAAGQEPAARVQLNDKQQDASACTKRVCTLPHLIPVRQVLVSEAVAAAGRAVRARGARPNGGLQRRECVRQGESMTWMAQCTKTQGQNSACPHRHGPLAAQPPTCMVRMSKRPRKTRTEMIRSSAVFSRSALVPEYLRQWVWAQVSAAGQVAWVHSLIGLCVCSKENMPMGLLCEFQPSIPCSAAQHSAAQHGPCAPGEHGQERGCRGVRRDGHLGRCVALLGLLAAGRATEGD